MELKLRDRKIIKNMQGNLAKYENGTPGSYGLPGYEWLLPKLYYSNSFVEPFTAPDVNDYTITHLNKSPLDIIKSNLGQDKSLIGSSFDNTITKDADVKGVTNKSTAPSAAGIANAGMATLGAGLTIADTFKYGENADMLYNRGDNMEGNVGGIGYQYKDLDRSREVSEIDKQVKGGVVKSMGAGAAAGGAIGSIIPGVGTAIGTAAGAVIGAVGGILGGASKRKKAMRALVEADNKAYAMKNFNRDVALTQSMRLQNAKETGPFNQTYKFKDGKMPKYGDGNNPIQSYQEWEKQWFRNRKPQIEDNAINYVDSIPGLNDNQRKELYPEVEYKMMPGKDSTKDPQYEKIKEILKFYNYAPGNNKLYENEYNQLLNFRYTHGLDPKKEVTPQDIKEWKRNGYLHNGGWDFLPDNMLLEYFNDVASNNTSKNGLLYAKNGKLPGFSGGKAVRSAMGLIDGKLNSWGSAGETIVDTLTGAYHTIPGKPNFKDTFPMFARGRDAVLSNHGASQYFLATKDLEGAIQMDNMYRAGGLTNFRNGKMPGFKGGFEGPWSNIVPSAFGMLAGAGQYFNAKGLSIRTPNIYAGNPYEHDAMATLAELRENPLPTLNQLRDAEARTNSAISQSGGLSAAQRLLSRASTLNTTLGNMAKYLALVQAQNNAYKQAYATTALLTGAQNAQRKMAASQFAEDMTAKAHAARQQGMQTGISNALAQLQNYYANEFKRNQFNETLGLYKDQLALDKAKFEADWNNRLNNKTRTTSFTPTPALMWDAYMFVNGLNPNTVRNNMMNEILLRNASGNFFGS